MMRKILSVLLAVCSLTICFETIAEELIIWYKTDQVPFYTPDEKGPHDQMVGFFVSHLPGYHHTFRKGNIRRAVESMRSNQPAVWLGPYKTAAREQFMLFHSPPLYLNLNTVLVIKKERLKDISPFLNSEHLLELEQLLLSKKLTIGITDGRSYSGIVDSLIAKYKNTGVFNERFATDMTAGYFKMLMADRIDAYFEMPISVKAAMVESGADDESIVSVPIAGLKPYEPVYLGIPASDWGKRLLPKIEQLVNDPETLDTFAGYYNAFLDMSLQATYQDLYRPYYEENFGIDFGETTNK